MRKIPVYQTRSVSLSPSRLDEVKYREALSPVRALIRDSFSDDSTSPTSSLIIGSGRNLNGGFKSSYSSGGGGSGGSGSGVGGAGSDALRRNIRLKSPSVAKVTSPCSPNIVKVRH